MNELMSVNETMSSLQIAEITEKRHDAVLRDIRNLLAQGVALHNFVESSYFNSQSREFPCYNLTKKGCLILASGYDALLREKIINRWEELELQKRNGGFEVPKTFAEALMLAAKNQQRIEEQVKEIQSLKEQNKELEEKNEDLSSKADCYDKVIASEDCRTTTQIANEIGMTAKELHLKLKELGVIYHQSEQWLLYRPFSTYGLHKTRTATFTRENGRAGTRTQTVWTERGRTFIRSLHKRGFDKKACKEFFNYLAKQVQGE